MKVAIFPARGGSKRIPRKNIRDFCGQPMLAWPIVAARQSGLFDHLVVSTDDPEIAEVAKAYGAEVPFMRPADLADDFTGTVPVIRHAIEQLQHQGLVMDAVCCIYPTAPFLQAADLTGAHDALVAQQADYVFSATRYPFPIQRALRLRPDGCVAMFWPENQQVRSQDLEPAFHDAGQFYWGQTGAWLSGQAIYDGRSVPYLLPRTRVQDIDTPEDWQVAEVLYRSGVWRDAG